MDRRLRDFGPLSPAERQVRDTLHFGRPVILGEGECPPEDAGPDRRIRASLLRYLCLGGDDGLLGPVPEKGVVIKGARVTGVFDVAGATLTHSPILLNCRFDARLNLSSTALPGMVLDGCVLADGCFADWMRSDGPVLIRNTQIATIFCLIGARIGADLDLTNSKLSGAPIAFLGDRLRAEGDFSLADAEVSGQVRLYGARVGGGFQANRARFAGVDGLAIMADSTQFGGAVFLNSTHVAGEARFVGANLKSVVDCANSEFTGNGPALTLDGAKIESAFFWRGGASSEGLINLAASQIRSIDDDPACWPQAGKLRLDRCVYGAFTGRGITAKDRIAWLDLQSQETDDFLPQPWRQCAHVLREMGHGEAATRVMIAKEHRQRRAVRRRMWRGGQVVRALWAAIWDRVLAVTVRYGRRPLLAVWWLIAFAALGAGVFAYADRAGAITPTQSSVTASTAWAACARQDASGGTNALPGEVQTDCFRRQPEGADLAPFNPVMYSIDTLVPVISFGVQSDWRILETAAPPVGHWVQRYAWLQIAMGWALSLLAVAGFSGLVKSE